MPSFNASIFTTYGCYTFKHVTRPFSPPGEPGRPPSLAYGRFVRTGSAMPTQDFNLGCTIFFLISRLPFLSHQLGQENAVLSKTGTNS